MVISRLIEAHDSVLVVIDVQSAFTERLSPKLQDSLVEKVCSLVDVASELNVPLVVTAEDMPNLGGVAPALAESLPLGTKVHNKMVFNLTGEPQILEAIRETGRGTAVLVGLETDVCVAQSALGLLQEGFDVVAVADACGSPGTGHDFGLERMKEAGVVVTSAKTVFFEWVRTVEGAKEQRARLPGIEALSPPVNRIPASA